MDRICAWCRGTCVSLSHLPRFLDTKRGHLAYYYYPYELSEPERFMPILGNTLADWRCRD